MALCHQETSSFDLRQYVIYIMEKVFSLRPLRLCGEYFLFPAFEAFPAIGQQVFVVLEIKVKAIL